MTNLLKAPAKINLFLKITGKRPDGYHELETIFIPLSKPFDELYISKRKLSTSLEITSSDNSIPLNENNICYQAAMKFANFAKIPPAWSIHIEKKIPVAAGLGGGSSDAAAVLKILNQMYSAFNDDILFDIARSLGADVPFFLDPVPSSAKGTGDILTPITSVSPISLVLVNPQFPISAAWAYKNYIADERSSSLQETVKVLQSGDLNNFSDFFQNDLQSAVFFKFPMIDQLKNSLLKTGSQFVGISGSGSTLFALCSSAEKAANVAENMKNEYSNAIYCIATTIFK